MKKKTLLFSVLIAVLICTAAVFADGSSLTFLPVGNNASDTTQSYGKVTACEGTDYLYFVLYNSSNASLTAALPDTMTAGSSSNSLSLSLYNYEYGAYTYAAGESADAVWTKVQAVSSWSAVTKNTVYSEAIPAAGALAFRARFADISRLAGSVNSVPVTFTVSDGTNTISNAGAVAVDHDDQSACGVSGKIVSAQYNKTNHTGTLTLRFQRSYSEPDTYVTLPSSFDYYNPTQTTTKLGSFDVQYAGGATELQIKNETADISGTFSLTSDLDSLLLKAANVAYRCASLSLRGSTQIEGTAYAAGALTLSGVCRDYTVGADSLSLGFTVNNPSGSPAMMVELPSSVNVDTYTKATGKYVQIPSYSSASCTLGTASCSSRIASSSGSFAFSPACPTCSYIEVAAGESMHFEVTTETLSDLGSYLSSDSAKVKSSLRYVNETSQIQQAAAFAWSGDSCTAEGSGDLTLVAGSAVGSYVGCDPNKKISFRFSVVNNGTSAAVTNPSSYRFYAGSVSFTPAYTVCTNDGTDCTSNLSSITLEAGKTLSLAGTFTTADYIQADSYPFMISSSANRLNISISAGKTSDVCTTKLSSSGSGSFDLDAVETHASLTLNNGASSELTVIPGSMALSSGKTAVSGYTGTVNVSGGSSALNLVQGSSFVIPAGGSASVNFTFTTKTGMTSADTKLSWVFQTSGVPSSYTAVIPLSANGSSNNNGSGTDWNDSFAFFPFYSNRTLPGTGFPSGRRTVLPAQPASLAYTNLGMTIEIPVIDASAEIVSVPQDENSWSVQWLGSKAGLLDGSLLPGQGTSVIVAHDHVDTGTIGPFAFLNSLNADDRIFVTDLNGKMLQFRVTANRLVKPEQINAVYQDTVPGSLVLITCENESVDGTYLNRRIVYAEPMQ